MLQPHIRCTKEDVAEYVLLPGDHKRLDIIETFLEDVKEIGFNREYRTITGYYKNIKVMAMSTGMGGPSTAIGVEELAKLGVSTMIRIGSCGALKNDIKIGDLIIASGAIRDEGTGRAYVDPIYPAIADIELVTSIIDSSKELNIPYYTGIVRTHDSFYTEETESKKEYWARKGVLGEDMETAALLVVASLRGVKAASILNNVVEYGNDVEEGINDYVDGESLAALGEKREIQVALEAIVKLDKNNQ